MLLILGLAVVSPTLGQGTVPPPKDTDVEITAFSKTVTARETMIRIERLRCRNPDPNTGVKAEFLDMTYRVDAGVMESGPCDEFPSSPHLNVQFLAELVRVRQQYQLPLPVPPRRSRGSFEGPVKFIRDGLDLLVNGRMQGAVVAGTHDVLFDPDFLALPGPEACAEEAHFEGVLTGTVDFPNPVRPRLKNGQLRAAVQGRGLVGPGGAFSPFRMRIEGSLEVHGPG
jgi:hypothetical protein